MRASLSAPLPALFDDVPGLTAEELAFWDEHGYVVVHDAVAAEDRDAAAAAIYKFLDADPGHPETWYGNKYGVTIWVPLLRHPAFIANRQAPRLVKAFAQLWGREDLWPTVDQGGFNPPEHEGWKFPGPHVHWDSSLAPPHCFGVQGILYLTDTPADQGAFSCIPGFHRTLDQWLKELPPSEDPAPGNPAPSGVEADCRQGRGPGALASISAPRRQPEPGHKAARGAVHYAAAHPMGVCGGVEVSFRNR